MTREVKKMSMNKLIENALKNEELQDEIIRMNTIEQLYEEGIDSDGNSLGDYSDYTKKIKQMKGQRADHITLNDSGEFYNTFRVLPGTRSFVIDAETRKRSQSIGVQGSGAGAKLKYGAVEETDLAQRFGRKILGLTNENREYVVAEVKDSVTQEIRKKLFA